MRQAATRRWIIGVVLAAFPDLGVGIGSTTGFFRGAFSAGPAGFGPGQRIGFGFGNRFGRPFGHGFGFGRFGGFPRFGFAAFTNPFTFGFHQPFFHPFVFPSGLRFSGGLADPDGFHFFAGPASGGFAFGRQWNSFSDPNGGWSYVERWKDQQPQPASGGSLADSLLLREGMDPEDVMKALGSPLKKIELGRREVWQYSGYSLLFEGGGLKEIR